MTVKEALEEARREGRKVRVSALAKELGVSRQRIYQVIWREGLIDVVDWRKRREPRTCVRCGVILRSRRKYCPICLSLKRRESWVELRCDQCGRRFLRRRCVVERGKARGQVFHFCSKECRGKFAGQWSSRLGGLKPYKELARAVES